ncbi:MAG: hypothetical protein U0792_22355 [Gemmataceae bacterium]
MHATQAQARLLMLAACQQHPAQLRHESRAIHGRVARRPLRRSAGLHEPFTGHALATPYRQLQSYASSLSDNPERGRCVRHGRGCWAVSTMKKLKEDFPYLVYSCLHDVAAGVSNRSTERRIETPGGARS